MLPDNEETNIIKIIKKHKNNIYIAIDCLIKYITLVEFLWLPSFYVPNNIKKNPKVYYGNNRYLIGGFKPNKILQKKKKIKNLAVFSGGSDVLNFNKIIIENIVSNLNYKLNIYFIIGPFSKKVFYSNNSLHNIKFIYGSKNIECLSKNIDLAITPHGVTLFELMYFGVPTITFIPKKRISNIELNKLKNKKVTTIVKSISELDSKLHSIISGKLKIYQKTKNALEFIKIDGVKEFVNKMIKTFQ